MKHIQCHSTTICRPRHEKLVRGAAIISFYVVENGEYFSVDGLKHVHTFLSKDISSVITEASQLEVALASKKCLVGQPVALGKLAHGVLYIALGADMVNHIYRSAKTMVEDAIALRKLQLILYHRAPLCARFVDAPATTGAAGNARVRSQPLPAHGALRLGRDRRCVPDARGAVPGAL